MVLSDLGSSITNALSSLSSASTVSDADVDGILREICKALLESDVDVALVQSFRSGVKSRIARTPQAPGLNRRKMVHRFVVEELTTLVNPTKRAFRPRRGKANVFMFIGLQGHGKTTTVMKIGLYYRRKGFKVGLVCADTFRAGAFAQLKQNATKAKLNYYGSNTEADPVKVAQDGVELFKAQGFDIILVDTSGRHKQESALFDEMKQIQAAVQPDDIVFILDASTGQAARGQADAFKSTVNVGSVVITKMDGHAKGGGALSAVAATGSPIRFLGVGEQMEDLEAFDPESFVSRLLGMGDLKGLAETVRDLGIENQEELAKKMASGNFSFRDMRSQFEMIGSMGSLSRIMGMLPGMGNMLNASTDQMSKQRIRHMMAILDSMTEKELDNPDLLLKGDTRSRILRIARGSGMHPQLVTELITSFQSMGAMFGGLGKMTQGGGGGAKGQQAMQKGMAQMAQQMGRLNPQMFEQMGGMEGLSRMMKDMSTAEAMAGLGRGGGMPGMPGLPGMPGMMGAGRGGRGRGRPGGRRR